MSKEITMSFHQFMEVERGNITLKNIDNSGYLENSIPNIDSIETRLKIAIITITTVIAYSALTSPTAVHAFTTYDKSSEVNKELLKEGFELLYKLTTETIKYGYKLFSAIM